jgi:hypothetical protein
MASMFDPKCGVPVYEQTDLDLVKKCSRINGYFSAGIISFFIIIVAVAIYISTKKIADPVLGITQDAADKVNKTRFIVIITVTCILLVLIWVGMPSLSAWMELNQWHSYQHERGLLKNQGYSDRDIVKYQQKTFLNQQRVNASRQRAAATASAGFEIASAIANR